MKDSTPSNRRRTGSALLILAGLIACLAVVAKPMGADLPPGGTFIKGSYNARTSVLDLDLTVKQAVKPTARILAVEVFTEPSHTLVYAMIDKSTPDAVRASILQDHPLARSESPIGAALPHVGIKAPHISADTGVRLVYWTLSKGKPVKATVSDAVLQDLSSFQFSYAPGPRS